MKTTHFTPAVWLGIAALTSSVWAQPPATAPVPAVEAGRGPEGRGGRGGRGGPGGPSNEPATLVFNFRGASLETVLTYMSEAAGFTIVLETPVRGTVDMFSSQPVTRTEALQLLSLALNKNGYTSIVEGRTIVIVSKDEAKKKNLPIRTGNSPDEIPNTAEMYIQIIPLRKLDATAAARDLGALLPGTATLTANTDSNSLIVTDTNINLKQIVKLVDALDTSSDAISTMRIFQLKNADPGEMAQLLTSLYSTTAQNQNGRGGQANAFGGANLGGAAGLAGLLGGAAAGGRGGGGGGGGGRGGGGRGGNTGVRSVPVVAVADPRTLSVIVTASKEQMPDIAEMITQLDTSSARKQQAFVYTIENGNVKQMETILKNLYPSSRNSTTTNNQPDALTSRATTNAQNTSATGATTASTTTTTAR